MKFCCAADPVTLAAEESCAGARKEIVSPAAAGSATGSGLLQQIITWQWSARFILEVGIVKEVCCPTVECCPGI